MRKIRVVLVATVAVAALAVTLVAVVTRGGDGGGYVSEHAQAVPPTLRTVFVSQEMPSPSVAASHLSAMLVSGQMPMHAVRAEVLTDTECAPDQSMISRCRNVVMLQNGSKLVLRHPHDMARIPCLAPREQIVLKPAAIT